CVRQQESLGDKKREKKGCAILSAVELPFFFFCLPFFTSHFSPYEPNLCLFTLAYSLASAWALLAAPLLTSCLARVRASSHLPPMSVNLLADSSSDSFS